MANVTDLLERVFTLTSNVADLKDQVRQLNERVFQLAERVVRLESREDIAVERARSAFLQSAMDVHRELAERVARLEDRSEGGRPPDQLPPAST